MKSIHWQSPARGHLFSRLMFEADLREVQVQVAKFAHEPELWGGQFRVLHQGQVLAVAQDAQGAIDAVRRVKVPA